MTELDERKAAILRAIVEQYVDTAQPVGSQTVTQTAGLGVSAATVRNEMSVLEREGYIAQPHTSAGPGPDRPRLPLLRRPPRRRGCAAAPPSGAGSPTSSPRATMAMDDLLPRDEPAARAASPRTRRWSSARRPSRSSCAACTSCCSSPASLLAVVVLSNGAVEKETSSSTPTSTDDDVGRRERALRRSTSPGRRLAELPGDPTYTGDAGDRADALAASRVVRRARARYVAAAPRASRSTSAARAGSRPSRRRSSSTTPRRVCSSCSNSTSCSASLMRELLGPGLTVRIGSENELADLRECSLVLAPYLVEGEAIGTVGVLGPTRMDYRKAQAAVVDGLATARTASSPDEPASTADAR